MGVRRHRNPGPLLRATAGDVLRVEVDNQLPAATSVHWHGLALRNDMDGVPGITQDPIPAGASFRYEFTVPEPGTYFYHPHSGVQLDRGLYGVLVVDDPVEPGRYDQEWGRRHRPHPPDQVLADLHVFRVHRTPHRGRGGPVGRIGRPRL
jgi:FtsP/CotA-like multicopper oxidase with cupredoxin domain